MREPSLLRGGPSGPIVIDCRWLGRTGIGRVTEMLLEGLRQAPPDVQVVLWGPPEVVDWRWPRADVKVTRRSPVSWFGQRDLWRVPRGRLLFLHVVRPLTLRRPATVMLHDFIPVDDGPLVRRSLWTLFFRTSLGMARCVVVYSDATAERLQRWSRRSRTTRRLMLPVDRERADRVAAMRTDVDRLDTLLYVGQGKPHKNLDRAIRAFSRSAFAASGGTLVLVVPNVDVHESLNDVARRSGAAVRLLGKVEDEALDLLFAGAAAVIQPSLAEGLGLTAVEALLAGVPVCASRIPPLVEATAGCAALFDPCDEASIARGIDEATSARGGAELAAAYRRARPAPSAPEFARRLLDLAVGHTRSAEEEP